MSSSRRRPNRLLLNTVCLLLCVQGGIVAGQGSANQQSSPVAVSGARTAAENHSESFTREDTLWFETHVRPLLSEHCFECHGATRQKGQLRLDSRAAVLSGGESGSALVPGDPKESLLLQAVRYESFQMPPNGRLADEKIAILEEWIRKGAAWPDSGTGPTEVRKEAGFTDADRAWWAIQPLRLTAPPSAAGGWCRNEIDQFILSQMTASGLAPAPEADRRTLIRRLSFDLRGLPPSTDEVQDFLTDKTSDAWEQLVDRFLASPQYGERWARQWLDVVRYADSDGYRIDHYRPDSWRYRDYVIRSLNQDKPYDRFVQEQLAGDELFPDNPDAMIATGYLRHWIYEYNNRDVRGQWDSIIGDVTDTTGDVFLGIGMQCAKCHDHKYDPILQTDYFRLRAFFESIKPVDKFVVASTAEQQSHAEQVEAWKSEAGGILQQIAELEQPYRVKAHRDALEKYPPDIQAILNSSPEHRTPLEQQLFELAWRQVDYEYEGLDNRIQKDDKEKLLALRKQLAVFDSKKPPALPTALTVTDVGPVAAVTRIPKKRTEVQPGFLSILGSADVPIEMPAGGRTTGRRTALARWLTQADNPLSTRVIVNRIWQGHFGRGLAENASDFGILGGPPSHPELLDWLTLRFLQNGWKLKDLHRLIVNSATYRQSSDHPQLAAFQAVDPLNRQYWKFSIRRLDAEQIRDAILTVSGQLNLAVGGPGVQTDIPRRSIYLRVMRNERDSLLDVFDLPLFFASTSSRNTTTSPVQSLLLFNSQLMMNHGLRFALTLNSESGASAAPLGHQIRTLWERAYSREPAVDEMAEAVEFLTEQLSRIKSERGRMEAAAVPVSRLPYRDGQAILVTPEEKSVRMSSDPVDAMNTTAFTLEACLQVRSVYETGGVRTIAARWDGQKSEPGWAFGVTGKASRRKPQTLVLQLSGRNAAHEPAEAVLFSDHHLELNVPYYVAVAVTAAGSDGTPGSAVFFLKNLSNDDEPLNSVTVSHHIQSEFAGGFPLTLGSRSGNGEGIFDGLLDDVRFSSTALSPEQLLLSSDEGSSTVAFWRFEPVPGLLEDSSAHARRLRLERAGVSPVSPEQAALADLCHVLLNSSEFLYVK